jgi:hypothetical protein
MVLLQMWPQGDANFLFMLIFCLHVSPKQSTQKIYSNSVQPSRTTTTKNNTYKLQISHTLEQFAGLKTNNARHPSELLDLISKAKANTNKSNPVIKSIHLSIYLSIYQRINHGIVALFSVAISNMLIHVQQDCLWIR